MTNQELPNDAARALSPAGALGSALTIGFGSAVFMWMLAWVLHMPGVHVDAKLAVPALMVPLFVITLCWSRHVAAPHRFKAALMGGLVAGLVNLLILGSHIVEQPETTDQMAEQANSFAPNALMTVVGSMVLSLIVAGIAGVLAGVLTKNKTETTIYTATTWRSRFAWVTALTYLPLIAVGGAVTSTDSGLAVPDAVTSYGAVSVLFPLQLMAEPRIFLEHSHRLFGTLAGLTTLVLMIRVLMGEPRKLPKMLAIVLFVAVSLQGYMGIIRVAEQSTFFAIIHGVFAQLVLAWALGTAIVLSDAWTNAAPSEETVAAAKRTRKMMLLTVIALLLQLVLGAVTRHLHSGHGMMAHMGFAFVVLMLVIIGGSLVMRTGKTDASGRAIRPFGALLHGLVVLQVTLGFAVIGMGWSSEEPTELHTHENLSSAPPIEASSLVTTAHHLIGALVLAAAVGALVWAIRLAIRPKAL